MQAAWAAAGVPISGGTTSQVHDGTAAGSVGTASNPRHVGMYAGGGLVVNAYDAKAGLMALGAALIFGAAITTAVVGARWQIPALDTWVAGVFHVVEDPRQSGARLGASWAPALAGHTGLYWTITVLVVVLGVAAVTAGAVPVWRRFGPGTPLGTTSGGSSLLPPPATPRGGPGPVCPQLS